jgi:hypothetical protein
MHGNESTATRAVFDFFNYLSSDKVEDEVKDWLKEVSLKIVPVVNPDGLERYQRRNALNIDPNRDAVRQSSLEIQTLFRVIKEFDPHWCFNMHDQRNLFNVKGSSEPACLSFLSPSTADGKRGRNQNEAMMMIAGLHHYLEGFIPGKMGRFTHEYYPTASGDNLQTLGYRTILVESGGFRGDVEREIPRKMNFLLLLEAIRLAATQEWERGTVLHYSEIPENDQKLFDFLIRNASIKQGNKKFKVDIGIDRVEVAATSPEGFVVKSSIRDIGDLSHYYGYDELDATGMELDKTLELNGVADFKLNQNGSCVVEVINGFLK